MTLSASDYRCYGAATYTNSRTGHSATLPPEQVAGFVARANTYLVELGALMDELAFPVYEALGQRNLSGFIGEVFSRFVESGLEGFRVNPHPDGRPDLVDVGSPEALLAFKAGFKDGTAGGPPVPLRASFNPFKYGGLEIKTTIGTPITGYKKKIKAELGIDDFTVGQARVKYLKKLTYWGHHTSCENLMGLYYDYLPQRGGAPQILAVFHSELDAAVDWAVPSIGKPDSKKTSNTSLTATGQAKMLGSPIVALDDSLYLAALRRVGAAVHPETARSCWEAWSEPA